MRRVLIIGLPILFILTGIPAAGQVAPGERTLRMGEAFRAAPAVHWSAEGLLIYSVAHGDSVAVRAVDPRTGSDRPHAPVADPEPEVPRVVRAGLFAHRGPVRELASPDQRWFAGTRDGDVWLRSAGTDDMTRFTMNGHPEYGYDIEGAKWSADGRRLAMKRMDARGVPTVPLVRWSEPGEPVVRHPYSRVGEPIPRAELYVASLEGGEPTLIDAGEGDAPYVNIVGWSGSGDELYFIRTSRFMDRVELRAADVRTRRSRVILAETSGTFIEGLPFLHGNDGMLDELNRIVPLEDDRRFVWTSERDGWRRLYLYELDGTLIRPLTPGGSEVDRLEAVDEERGWAYYTARIDPERPYDVTLLRVPLDGGEPERLVEGPTFNRLEFDPAREFFLVMRGGIDRPPVAELRRSNGALVRELWSAAEIAREVGWIPPEQVRALAADGKTQLHGILFKPQDFDPGRQYPVVDHIYLGPHTAHVPRSMLARNFGASQMLADRGFVVLLVDSRGTPGRGRALLDAFFGQFGQHEIADHAAVLRQLAAERPYMDLGRVGVFGHSWGGYGALRALLLEPDLYRVGVASAPAVDIDRFRVSLEPFMGCLPSECPEAYERGSSTRLIHRLEGKLLLLHGTSDDDVPFGDSVGLIDALMRAGKPYDLVIFPEGHHGIQSPYWWQRVAGYLMEHLQP